MSDATSNEADPERRKAVVMSKRLPQDFTENTLMPHIEAQLLDNIHVYTPAELAKIARVYSKQETRQHALSQKLGETVAFRIEAFEAVDIVDIVGALWILCPGADDTWEALEARIVEKIEDFSLLNLMGIARVYNKRVSKHDALMNKIVPQCRKMMRDYEAVELSEILVSLAQSAEAAQDMDILALLVPEIERRYTEVSLVHRINNVWALTQLKVVHEGLLDKVAADLSKSAKTRDLTPAYMSRITWVYRRCSAWDKVAGVMLPLIRASAAEFRTGDFARLAQALPDERVLLSRIADVLRGTLPEMGRKDFLLFLNGCTHGELLESAPGDSEEPGCLVAECLRYARDEQDNFKRDEVQKIVYLLRFSKKYQHLLDELPVSWAATKEETLDFIRAKGL